jgi:hypothetical protein
MYCSSILCRGSERGPDKPMRPAPVMVILSKGAGLKKRENIELFIYRKYLKDMR